MPDVLSKHGCWYARMAMERGTLMDSENGLVLGIAGLVIGLILGGIVQRSRFCMTAVVSNYVILRDVRLLHTYCIAILLSMGGVFILEHSGVVSIGSSVYRSPDIHWLSSMLGGLIFGIGAVMAGGCIGRILTLTGEGNLSGLLALFAICLGATVVYTGVLEPVRIWIYQLGVIQTDDSSLLSMAQIPTWMFVVFLLFMFLSIFWTSVKNHLDMVFIITGIGIGLLVLAGWWVTGSLAADEFSVQRPSSLTFSGPLMNASLYLTVTSQPQNVFGFMLVIGVLCGSFISAISTRRFHIEPLNSNSVTRIFNGGLLMGVGATMAGGCNIGQGITGLSTLSVESILAVIFIFLGMYVGVKGLQYFEEHPLAWSDFWNHFSTSRESQIQ